MEKSVYLFKSVAKNPYRTQMNTDYTGVPSKVHTVQLVKIQASMKG